MKSKEEQAYEEAFHRGAIAVLNDLIDHGKDHKDLLMRIEYWTVRLEMIGERNKNG